MIITIESKIPLKDNQIEEVDSCLVVFSYYYRKAWYLFNNKQKPINEVRQFLARTNELSSDQCDSIINKVSTEHKKIKELTKVQLKDLEAKIKSIEKFKLSEVKKIADNKIKINELKNFFKIKSSKNLIVKSKLNNPYNKLSKLIKSNDIKQKVLWQKNKKLERLNKRFKILNKRIETNIFSLCFGSKRLLKQNPNHISRYYCKTYDQTAFSTKEDWQKEWQLARDNVYFSVGRSREINGNRDIKYSPNDKSLRIRLVEKVYQEKLKRYCLENDLDYLNVSSTSFGEYGSIRNKLKYLTIDNIVFAHKNQNKIKSAVLNQQPITSKIIKKRNRDGYINYYLQLTFEEPEADLIKHSELVLGIDLNNDGLAYSIVKADGNRLSKTKLDLKSFGYIKWDLEDKSSEQRQWLISNKIDEVLKVANTYGISKIAIENLDFSKTLNQMNSGYKSEQKYNKMLSQFAKTTFSELIIRKSKRLGIEVNLVNPANSSVGGFSKYGIINKVKVDIAASIWLARQALFGVQYKKESNVVYKKSFKEDVRFPFVMDLKRSSICKKVDPQKLKWNHVSFALGKNRVQWYQNFKNSILSSVVTPQFPDDFDPFSQSYLENSY